MSEIKVIDCKYEKHIAVPIRVRCIAIEGDRDCGSVIGMESIGGAE